MFDELSEIERSLLNDFQRDLPICRRPFSEIAKQLDISERQTLDHLSALKARGLIARVGATVRPNTVGASTLAALSVPVERIEEVAAIVGREPGVNHSYLREHAWNLWFVATAPDREALAASLAHIEAATGLCLLDLRLVRPFNIDLGFSLTRPDQMTRPRGRADMSVIEDRDRPLLDILTKGLPLVARPFADVATALGRTEADVMRRIEVLAGAGILTRIGVIVRHRAIGWKANAMVVWQVPGDAIEAAGTALAAHPGVTLCYQRNTVPDLWPYTLFSMIHARSRDEALGVLNGARRLDELRDIPHDVLFSTRCFKQTGALLDAPETRQARHETHSLARACA